MADYLSLERMDRVTGSRIAGILGISPYRTRAQVMREMVREHHWAEPEFTGNWATEYGSEHEPEALEEYELAKGVTLSYTGDDQKTYVDADRRLAVTPDGVVIPAPLISETVTGAVEAKCPFRALYTSWQERPDYQQQMHLTAELLELDSVDFAVWRPSGLNITTMPHDESWWPSVQPAIDRFLEEFDRIVASEELSYPYLEVREGVRTDEEWAKAEATYLELAAEKERLDQMVAATKTELERLAGTASAKGTGLHVIYRQPAAGGEGAISYKKLSEALADKAGVELTPEYLSQFRGKPSKGGGRGTYAYKLIGDDD